MKCMVCGKKIKSGYKVCDDCLSKEESTHKKRAYDNCQAKSDILGIEERLDKGAEKIKSLSDDMKKATKEIQTNRRYDKAILAIGFLSFVVNILR